MREEQNLIALNVIRKEGKLTRQELATQLEISQSQATKLVADLTARGLLIGNGKLEAGNSGRRADWLSLAPEAAYAVGIHLSNSRQWAVVTDLLGEVVGEIEEPVLITDHRDAIVDGLKKLIERVGQQNHIPGERVAGVGLALSDMVDPIARRSYGWPDTPGWSAAWTDFPVGEALEAVLPYPHILADDVVRTLGLAEARYGHGKDLGDFTYVLAGQGLGMAILLGGHPYIGDSHIAGELAHIPVGLSTEPCNCGNVGCLHTLTTVPVVLSQVDRRLRESSIRSSLRLLGKPLAIEDVLAAEGEDKLARQVLTDAGEALGRGLAMVVNLLGPRSFILGGELSRSEHFVDATCRSMKMHALDVAARGVSVISSHLDQFAGARGAATEVLDALFQSDQVNLLNFRGGGHE